MLLTTRTQKQKQREPNAKAKAKAKAMPPWQPNGNGNGNENGMKMILWGVCQNATRWQFNRVSVYPGSPLSVDISGIITLATAAAAALKAVIDHNQMARKVARVFIDSRAHLSFTSFSFVYRLVQRANAHWRVTAATKTSKAAAAEQRQQLRRKQREQQRTVVAVVAWLQFVLFSAVVAAAALAAVMLATCCCWRCCVCVNLLLFLWCCCCWEKRVQRRGRSILSSFVFLLTRE